MNTEPLFRSGEPFTEDTFLNDELDELYELTRKEIINIVGVDSCVLLVNMQYDDPVETEVFVFRTEEELADFLQGLMTMLEAFNIDIGAIVFAAPFRGNTNYMINNIRLPQLE